MNHSLGVSLLTALSLTVVSCAVGDRDTARSGDSAATSTSGGAPSAVTKVAAYVDVRTPEEFASGHVAGAINIPHDQMAARFGELAEYRDSSIVLYCQSGRRSGIALDVLMENGFTKAVNGGGVDEVRGTGVAFENGQ